MEVLCKDMTLGFYNEFGIYNIPIEQYDIGRIISITFTNQGEVFQIPDNTLVFLKALKPDGNEINTDQYCYVNKKENTVEICVFNQLSIAAGVVKCEIILANSEGLRYTSSHFNIVVNRSVNNDEHLKSTDQYRDIVGILVEIEGLRSELISKSDILDKNDKIKTDKLYEASTEQKGIVQLVDSVESDSITDAATPNSVKTVKNSLDDTNHLVTELTSAVNEKVDKISGKGLSSNDYTDSEKNKLAGIAADAGVNVQSDWNVTDINSDAYIKNKPEIPNAVNKAGDAMETDAMLTFPCSNDTSGGIDLATDNGEYGVTIRPNGITAENGNIYARYLKTAGGHAVSNWVGLQVSTLKEFVESIMWNPNVRCSTGIVKFTANFIGLSGWYKFIAFWQNAYDQSHAEINLTVLLMLSGSSDTLHHVDINGKQGEYTVTSPIKSIDFGAEASDSSVTIGSLESGVASDNISKFGITKDDTANDAWKKIPTSSLVLIDSNVQSNNFSDSLPTVKGCLMLFKNTASDRGWMEFHSYENQNVYHCYVHDYTASSWVYSPVGNDVFKTTFKSDIYIGPRWGRVLDVEYCELVGNIIYAKFTINQLFLYGTQWMATIHCATRRATVTIGEAVAYVPSTESYYPLAVFPAEGGDNGDTTNLTIGYLDGMPAYLPPDGTGYFADAVITAKITISPV